MHATCPAHLILHLSLTLNYILLVGHSEVEDCCLSQFPW
jgi:hypothetical protein